MLLLVLRKDNIPLKPDQIQSYRASAAADVVIVIDQIQLPLHYNS